MRLLLMLAIWLVILASAAIVTAVGNEITAVIDEGGYSDPSLSNVKIPQRFDICNAYSLPGIPDVDFTPIKLPVLPPDVCTTHNLPKISDIVNAPIEMPVQTQIPAHLEIPEPKQISVPTVPPLLTQIPISPKLAALLKTGLTAPNKEPLNNEPSDNEASDNETSNPEPGPFYPVSPGEKIEIGIDENGNPIYVEQEDPAIVGQRAQEWLADYLDVPTDNVEVIEVAWGYWPDSCLGVCGPDEACLMMTVLGYRIVCDVDGKEYEVREGDGVYRVVEL